MKLRFFSTIRQGCDLACAGIHRVERVIRTVEAWAWTRATRENLKTCCKRAVKFHL